MARLKDPNSPQRLQFTLGSPVTEFLLKVVIDPRLYYKGSLAVPTGRWGLHMAIAYVALPKIGLTAEYPVNSRRKRGCCGSLPLLSAFFGEQAR